MPNPSRYDGTLEAAIRAHFALTQDELARYLGVTERQIGNIEAGRRQPSPIINQRLHWLADLLPPPEGTGPAAPVFAAAGLPVGIHATLLPPLPELAALPAAPLRQRRQQVLAQAAALRRAGQQQARRQAQQQRRQWTLGVLQAAPPPPLPTAADQDRFAHWLASLTADVQATAPGPDAAANAVLAQVRLWALEAEAAALAQLLAT